MANQKGIIKLKGTIGDITFYKSKDGYMAREKGGIDAKRFHSDPAFKRTRENAQEFGHSGKIGSLIRRAFRPVTMGISDSKLTSRFVKVLMSVVKTDAVNNRGDRLVTGGVMNLMEGFDFNVKANLKKSFFNNYDIQWDRTTGESKITFAPFVPQEHVGVPNGTTHFRIVAGSASIDFDTQVYELKLDRSTILPWDQTEIVDLELIASLAANSTNPVITVLGIEFYQEVNGVNYMLNNGGFNAASIVKVDQV
ncbi:hypothetical protein [Myroides guanonis]|uniref:Uncharacterized protein n=1 Tax=Myroides guanonis TaxID=1150112 RepID=A0A1I3L251_9FLAO|nr:hypothetical protein [Myroides guanonis]SFI78802.1 hypothetical protein SAMN04487893_101147 [Myroides guanonis]